MNNAEVISSMKAYQEANKDIYERMEECSDGHSKIIFDNYLGNGCPLCQALSEITDQDSLEELRDEISSLKSTNEDLEEKIEELEDDLEERNKAIKDLEATIKGLEK